MAAAIVVFGWSAWTATQTAPADPAPLVTTRPGPGRISVSAALVDPQLVATRALVDFGLDARARYVGVRILSGVDILVVTRAETDIVLADREQGEPALEPE